MTAALAPPTVPAVLDEQDRVISRQQALHCGMSEDAWQWRLSSGRWQSVLPGVAVAHTGDVTDRQQAWAAVLYAGRGAALSADAALVQLGMRLEVTSTLHVAVPADRIVRPQVLTGRGQDQWNGNGTREERPTRLRAHRVNGLAQWRHPIHQPPLLRAAPAVLHAAAWASSDRAAEWRIAAAVQQRLVRPTDLRAALELMSRLPRRALVLTVLDDVELGAHAASELGFLRFLRRHRLPAPDELQRVVRTGRQCYLDAWWERQRVSVELDGAHHRLVGAWEADALRANDVVLAERHDRVLLLRLMPGHLRHDGPRVAAQLRAALR